MVRQVFALDDEGNQEFRKGLGVGRLLSRAKSPAKPLFYVGLRECSQYRDKIARATTDVVAMALTRPSEPVKCADDSVVSPRYGRGREEIIQKRAITSEASAD
jgi:hypothetical protein